MRIVKFVSLFFCFFFCSPKSLLVFFIFSLWFLWFFCKCFWKIPHWCSRVAFYAKLFTFWSWFFCFRNVISRLIIFIIFSNICIKLTVIKGGECKFFFFLITYNKKKRLRKGPLIYCHNLRGHRTLEWMRLWSERDLAKRLDFSFVSKHDFRWILKDFLEPCSFTRVTKQQKR